MTALVEKPHKAKRDGQLPKDIPTNLHEISFFEERLKHNPDSDISFIDAWEQGGDRYVICYVAGVASVYRLAEVAELIREKNIPQDKLLFAPDLVSNEETDAQILGNSLKIRMLE